MNVKNAATNVIVKETVIMKTVVARIVIVQLKNGQTTLLMVTNCNVLGSRLGTTNIW
jgi:hypothetical protein